MKRIDRKVDREVGWGAKESERHKRYKSISELIAFMVIGSSD